MPDTASGTSLTAGASAADRRRWIALVVVCLAMLMNALDSSIVNVALPSIQRSLHFSQSGLTWVIDAYLIAFGSFLLLAGRLGDLIGRKKVFLSGVAMFTAASGVCAIAPNQATLIIARFAQGLGGAVSSSVIIAIIITEFPLPADRAKAMSSYILVTVGGGSLGLLAGGVLTQAVNWHWIFVINIPIGIVTFTLGVALIPENVGLGVGRGLDVTGSLLVTASLLVGIYAIVTAATKGWASAHTVGFLAIAVVLLVCFFTLESRLANPIMPLRILHLRSLVASSLVRGLIFTGMYAVFFFGALYLEQIHGYGPLRTGIAFLPMTLVVAILAMGITSSLLARFGALKVLIPALVLTVIGLLLLTTDGVHASYAGGLLPPLLLMAIGMGTASVPLLTLAMADVPVADAGLASGIVNVSMWLSSSIGLAVLSSLAASRTSNAIRQGHSTDSALVSGYHLAFLVAGCCAAAALIAALTLLREKKLNQMPGAPITSADESGATDSTVPAGVRIQSALH